MQKRTTQEAHHLLLRWMIEEVTGALLLMAKYLIWINLTGVLLVICKARLKPRLLKKAQLDGL